MGFFNELDSDVADFVPLLQSINKQLQDINARLAVSGIGGSSTGIPEVKTQSYKGHLWLKVPEPISNFTAKYTLPHKIDAVIATCPFDFQFDVDTEVSNSTPVNLAFSAPAFDVSGSKYISYRIPQSVYNAKTAKGIDLSKYKIPFYVYLFSYGD
ncbi:MAG: hypothetical protein ACYDAO_04495 [Thermoplasmataceae archaeon]